MVKKRGTAGKSRDKRSNITLTQWIIESADSEAYRAGKLTGTKHPKPDQNMIRAVGGLPELIRQADELERQGYVRAEKINMGADIKVLHYGTDVIPKLCEKEGVEDPRKKQLRYLKQMELLRAEVRENFLETYYDEIIERLQVGKKVKEPDLEDTDFFHCLNAVVNLKETMWKRVFSVAVLGDSKKFKEKYEKKVISVLTRSPLFAEGMTDDELLSVHGILSYTQTMEWKGALRYKLESDDQMGQQIEIDTSGNRYGTVINSQTLEHAVVTSMSGIRRVITIENKANYEDMKYRDDTLYLYCHGFYSPKERGFLRKLVSLAEKGTEYFHWGDMDLGGIRIFLFNKANIFPELRSYKMDKETFDQAIQEGAGIPLKEEKRKKLEKLDAGDLEELKTCILENGLEIEQEILLAFDKVFENRL